MFAISVRRSAQAVVTLTALLVCGFAGRAPAAGDSRLDQFVPEMAEWYLHVPRPDRVESVLMRDSLRPLIRRLTEAGAVDAASASLRGLTQRFLGPESAIPSDELLACEWLIVGPAFGEALRGAWLIRLPDGGALDRWFPKDRRQSERRVRQARLIRMRDGTYVCEREGVISVARRFSDEQLVRTMQILMVLGSVRGRPLADREDYQGLVARFDRDPLFLVYTAKRTEPPAQSKAAGDMKRDGTREPGADANGGDKRRRPAYLPEELALSSVLIGAYDRPEGIDLVIRAASAAPSSSGPLSNQAIERLMSLPQTTLAAIALTLDFGRAFAIGAEAHSPDAVQRYLKLLSDMSRGDAARNPVLTRIGPDVILIWGQDLSDSGETPQFAVMVRSPDARAVRGEINKLARNLIGLIQAVDPVPAESAPTFKLVSYLGTPIVHVPLAAYAAAGDLPFAKALKSLDPAWTSWRDWVILALDRTHVERILDAQAGLAPTLAELPEVQSFRGENGPGRVAAVVQSGLAAELVRDWLSRADSDAASLWNALWWTEDSSESPLGPIPLPPLVEESATGRLMIGPGPATTTPSPLLPGDHILGVDGQLLAMSSASEDFTGRLSRSKSPGGPVVRLLREGRMLDVTLPRPTSNLWRDSLQASPLNLLREFAQIGESVRIATVSISADNGNQFETRISLRFSSPDNP